MQHTRRDNALGMQLQQYLCATYGVQQSMLHFGIRPESSAAALCPPASLLPATPFTRAQLVPQQVYLSGLCAV